MAARCHRLVQLCGLFLAMLLALAALAPLVAFAQQSPLNEPGSDSQSELEKEIASFVTEVYFKAGFPSAIDPADLYTDIVSYWGKGNLPRAQVLEQKDNYYQRWPIRKFSLRDLDVKESQDASQPVFYFVKLRYSFDVSGKNGTRKGEGVARLVLIEDGYYGFLIHAEDGRVTARFR